MRFLNSWLQGIIVSVVIATIIELILPNGNTKKYIKVVLGVYVVFNIITPVINKLSSNNFEISSIINIDEYTKQMETYEVSSKNINISKTNEDNIKQVYLSTLRKGIKSKLEEQGYTVNDIKVDIENDENYTINKISLALEKDMQKNDKNENEKLSEQVDIKENNKEETKENATNTNKVVINEIETVKIQVGENKQNNEQKNTNKSKLTDKEKKEVKKYLVTTYEIKEKQIEIY